MEATSSGEHTPNNNNVTHQQQRSTQNVRSSNSSSYINERRQMLTHNERERIHSMTQQRRQSYLARRRSNYRRRQDNDRSSIPDESNLGNSNFVAPTTMIQQSPHNIGENLVDVTTVRQTCRSEPISFRTLTSNYERGSSSTCLPRPNSVIQDNEEGRHFRRLIRAYNHVFSFTSMGVNIDESLTTGTHGIYTFRAQGSIYHSIGSLLPNENCRPRYMQMWIVDTDHDIDNRLHENPELRRELLLKIQNILDQHNPFVHVFRQIGKCQDIPNCRLIIRQQKPNEHQYSLPTTSQVAAVIVDNECAETLSNRDITIQGIGGNLISIQDVVGYYDPLQYPLLLPYGTYGWDLNSRNINGTRLTCLNYYAYMLQIRENSPSLILRGGRLLQQYVVDNYVKIETQRLRWIRSNQRDIRSELYQGLQDCLHGGENHAGNIGTRIVLPSSFGGSPRDIYQRYQDAMTLVQTYGKPDLMLTMTCNPNWNEIKNQLFPRQSPQDRPDLITRIFRSKFEEFKKDIVDRGVLGKVRSYSYVIEYQKRGLPHVHMLVIFENNDKLSTLDHFDSIVRAEIPSQTEEPNLHKAVVHHMIHGPCGSISPNCPCMVNGKCKKNFPKPFVEYTSRGNDSYPLYRRREGGQVSIPNNDDVFIDNGWVVPYNPWLLLKYDCHINVEVCGGIKCVKYIYKYIHKGPDRVALELRNGQNCDEIQQYVDGRWISAPEALWRIFSFEFSRMYPSVIRLQLHTPNQHLIYFDPQQRVSDLLADDDNSKTMLTEFFKLNCEPDMTEKYLYREFPQFYTWIKSGKKWIRRRSNNKVVGRVYVVSSSEGERFYLRILLNHVRGPTSFEDLMTVNGVTYSTFKESAQMRGLLRQDDYVIQCLQEARSVRMSSSLRRLFVSILVFCQPTTVRELWDEFHPSMCEDYGREISSSNFIINKLLVEIRRLLHQYKMNLDDFDLPSISAEFLEDAPLPRIIEDDLSYHISDDDLRSIERLNAQQRIAFDTIIESITHNQSKLFFIDGPGGTGKTFLYRSMLAHLRKMGKIIIAVATSGIAATLLPGGRTAHSRFQIPLRPTASTLCKIKKQTELADLIRRASAIVWDEAPMANRYAFESVSKSFQDIMENQIPFGGKTMVFGGDFRQVLPVVKRGSKAEQIATSISRSTFWNCVKIIHLQQNMRSAQDIEFSQFLLRVGDGLQHTVNRDFIKLPDSIIIPWEGEQSIQMLIDSVFPNMINHVNDEKYMVDRAIITPKNVDVDNINQMLILKFPGEEKEYTSWDSVEDDNHNLFQEEFLNSLSPSGLPPHKIILKVGSPVMLLRNVAPELGLCNGTRLICRILGRNFIDAEIITGPHKGNRYFLHRMPLKSEDNSGLPFELTR
ncbi:uncharacterized protein [Primulina eburnea]|uniref:uncharacterized protein isoform X3 n=1 Tax=Primulina eburnea TaxID=1245227 RepID=UPI003C6C8DFB